MTEASTTAPAPNSTDRPVPTSGDRLSRFERELEAIGHRTSRTDRKWAIGGAAAMAVGVAITVIAYTTSTSFSDTRDVISSGILATVGLSVVIVGGVVFVRSSITEFLRFWMLRMIYEQQHDRGGER